MSRYRGMKSAALAFFGALVLGALGGLGTATAHDVELDVSIGVSDYDYLEDYGEWVRVSPHGRVWCPYVREDWGPYHHGHWAWTNYGWTWISYEPFGWLVFHYGYWDWSPRYGWVWIPGTRWYPARVQWYMMGDYYAWAPMPPPGVYWPDPWDRWHVNVWFVVGTNDFMNDDVYRHRVEKPVWREVHRREMVRRAPAVGHVEKVTKRSIPRVKYEREMVNVRPEAVKRPPRPGQPVSTELRRVKLPEEERERVKEHTDRVEREVLKPASSEQRERRRATEQKIESKQKESKKESKQKESKETSKDRRR